MLSNKNQEEIRGAFDSIRWRSNEPETPFIIASLMDGTVVKGVADPKELVRQMEFRFFGVWEENPKYGKSFRFYQYLKAEPHSRIGVVTYLRKYAPGVGPAIAGKLFDLFGTDAVKVLRTDPERAANETKLTLEKAREAAESLKKLAAIEDIRIELTGLFAGRNFPGKLVDMVVAKFGQFALHRIKKDPFCLMVMRFPGCGFNRCDRLYLDLGNDPARMKRQLLCIWYALRSNPNGHTWHPISAASDILKRTVQSAKADINQAIRLGVRAHWLVTRQDQEGRCWIAEAQQAGNEAILAECVLEILGGTP